MNESEYYALEFTDAEIDAQADAGELVLTEEAETDDETRTDEEGNYIPSLREAIDVIGREMGMGPFVQQMNYHLYAEWYFVNWLAYKGRKIGLMPDDPYALWLVDFDGRERGEPGYTDVGRWNVFVDDVLILEKIQGESRAFASAKRHIDA